MYEDTCEREGMEGRGAKRVELGGYRKQGGREGEKGHE